MATYTLSDYTGSLNDAQVVYDKNLLMRATPNLVFYNFGQKRAIKKNSGNQISYRRYNSLTAATTAITDGVTPSADSLSLTEVTGTVQQYGNYVSISDNVDMLAIDPVVMEATDVLGENAGESVDTIVRDVVKAGTNVVYATGSTRGAQSASNPITLTLVRKSIRALEVEKAKPFRGNRNEQGQGGVFIGIIHPYAWYDLKGDTEIQDMFTYSDPERRYTNTLPMLEGIAWYVTTLAPVFTGEGSGSADVYGTVILGKEAYGVVDVATSGRFKTIVKPLGSAGTEDPLDQRSTVAWKSWQLPKILNNNFTVRIEAGVSA